MKITDFEDTDTALVEFSTRPVVETRETWRGCLSGPGWSRPG